MKAIKFTIKADVNNLAALRRRLEQAALSGNADEEAVSDMVLVANEAATNSIEHGYRGTSGVIEVEVRYEGDDLVVYLRDDAPRFDPTQAPAVEISSLSVRQQLGGKGLHLMRALTDEFSYRAKPAGGNELKFVKSDVLNRATKLHQEEAKNGN